MAILIRVILGYMVAAAFSSLVFMNLSLTVWSSIWTYVWIVGGIMFVGGGWLLFVVFFAALLAALKE